MLLLRLPPVRLRWVGGTADLLKMTVLDVDERTKLPSVACIKKAGDPAGEVETLPESRVDDVLTVDGGPPPRFFYSLQLYSL
mmetsp:Transcript_8118/g.25061  ORF Transcript_8118/g.25061 Transcript_8118/m.25061 type:complete len:82 (+) Transcript_8118:552-797(+)